MQRVALDRLGRKVLATETDASVEETARPTEHRAAATDGRLVGLVRLQTTSDSCDLGRSRIRDVAAMADAAGRWPRLS
jgi:hypothetical protein